MNIINRFTLQTLKKNKVRTAVTIIGILLSTAMFTAVTSIIVSLQQYMIDTEIEADGAWHGRLDDLTKEQAEQFRKSSEIADSTLIQNVGYAKIENCINENKPYLCVESIHSNFTKMSPVKLTAGRMAKNSSELVISEHLSSNGNVNYKIGDILNLEVGKREAGEGIIWGQEISYDKAIEKLTDLTTKTYTVVGICERPAFEGYSAPGYTAFTTGEPDTAYSYDVLYQMDRPQDIDKFTNKFLKTIPSEQRDLVTYSVHSGLLRSMGKSPNENFTTVLMGMGAILMGIIMIASISLIYNAFSISISERTKQFGLLKSIGATKKQIRKSVLFEAFSLCLIGIPLGIGSGLLGIGITLHFVGKLMKNMMANATTLELELTISPYSIIIAAAIALITVVISAMLPARRAVKMPAIQALRESNEIKLRRKNVRTSKLTYKLFGFEGMLANKNLKRNRRKHRLTVASLALSVILFLSTSCFSNYMMASTDIFDDNSVDDISISAKPEEFGKDDFSTIKLKLKQLRHINETAYSQVFEGIVRIDMAELNSTYLELLEANAPDLLDTTSKKAILNASLVYIDDNTYKKYLEEKNLNLSKYVDSKSPCPLIWDNANILNKDGTVLTLNMLSGKNFSGEIYAINSVKKHDYMGLSDAAKLTLSYSEGTDGEDAPKEVIFSKEKALTQIQIADAKIMSGKLPLGVEDRRWGNYLTILMPYSSLGDIPEKCQTDYSSFGFYFQAKNHKKAVEELSDFFKNTPGYNVSLASCIYNKKEVKEANLSLVMVINIFSYGFITLITLIVVANVFNTISTNIQLRRKEFAMLKSVGMTTRGFDRMMNYECILYGVKGLLIGLPVSLIICCLMHKSLTAGWQVPLMIPWVSVIIVCISVFVIVFASMLYSMSKIKKDNPIDALRNDNL